jgi:hypothetical protein
VWLLGEVVANIFVDFVGFVIDVIAACFSRKRPPQAPVSGAPASGPPASGASFRQALAARRARRDEQHPPRER